MSQQIFENAATRFYDGALFDTCQASGKATILVASFFTIAAEISNVGTLTTSLPVELLPAPISCTSSQFPSVIIFGSAASVATAAHTHVKVNAR